MMKRIAAVALAVIAVFAVVAPVTAQPYPSRTVTIIVPYPAGGPTDQVARVLAQSLSDKLKQNFIVENVSGGGTTIATNRVAKATPDGYLLLIHNLQISANVALYKNLPFDTEKDLTPIMFINNNPLVLVGRKTLEPNTLTELLALMKKQTIKAATPGVGATGHLATSLLAQEAKVKIDLIPYRGAAPALQDIAGGHVDLFFATPQSVVQQVKAGQMKAYGITAKEKSPQLPNVESFVKALGPKLEILYWHAIFAPAGTPEAIINKLNATLQEIVSDPAVAKPWTDTGVMPYAKDQRSTAAARAILKSEIARWGQVVRDNNIPAPQ
ncbi:MAG: tripartite tricarboxylate transporter substrate binding protein [Rhizobiales bacterium]|nr:tripartite tricarboxylate transporter substrate binding protein [Hyphomicrobiales bacterium]